MFILQCQCKWRRCGGKSHAIQMLGCRGAKTQRQKSVNEKKIIRLLNIHPLIVQKSEEIINTRWFLVTFLGWLSSRDPNSKVVCWWPPTRGIISGHGLIESPRFEVAIEYPTLKKRQVFFVPYKTWSFCGSVLNNYSDLSAPPPPKKSASSGECSDSKLLFRIIMATFHHKVGDYMVTWTDPPKDLKKVMNEDDCSSPWIWNFIATNTHVGNFANKKNIGVKT